MSKGTDPGLALRGLGSIHENVTLFNYRWELPLHSCVTLQLQVS